MMLHRFLFPFAFLFFSPCVPYCHFYLCPKLRSHFLVFCEVIMFFVFFFVLSRIFLRTMGSREKRNAVSGSSRGSSFFSAAR